MTLTRYPWLKYSMLVWLVLILVGCHQSANVSLSSPLDGATSKDTNRQSIASATPTKHPTVTPSPSPTSTPAPMVMPPPGGIPHYTLYIHLDYAEKHLEVEERIWLWNDTDDVWDKIVLAVPPAHQANAFELRLVTLTTAYDQYVATVDRHGIMFHIPLNTPLAPKAPLEIQLGFAIQLPTVEATAWPPVGNFGWSQRLIQMGDWHPTLVPYQPGEGWQTWEYYPVGDPVVYEGGTYNVKLVTGEEIIVAAPGLVQQEGTIRHYHLDHARSFAFLASPEYEKIHGNAGDIPVASYFLPEYAEAGQAVLDTAIHAIKLYEELYGPYPYAMLALAQNAYYGAMEYSGIISLTGYGYTSYTNNPTDLLIILTAHEIAHQWWYGAVGNDQIHAPWLDESFAKYSEVLYYERYAPHLTDWWWEQSVYKWNPSGPLDSTIYDYPDTATYVHMVYGQGARFMADLRALMGDEAFFAFVQAYYQDNGQNRLVTKSDFFASVRDHTDADLSPLLTRYFSNPPPELLAPSNP